MANPFRLEDVGFGLLGIPWLNALLIASGITRATGNHRNDVLRDRLKEQYPNLTEEQLDTLVEEYGDKNPEHFWEFGYYGDQTDKKGLNSLFDDINSFIDEYGYAPEALSVQQLEEIEQNANAAIDAENRQILDLYDQTFNRSTEALEQNLAENSAAFSDFRNQTLTTNLMNQQAIAGSTRYELDRQQRNAITRGASAAQRLVANINTQLGTQAQAAQQSLETSNSLAQQLLTQRQAQTGLRQDYTAALNQRDMNRAGQLSGLTERKLAHSRSSMDHAISKRDYAYDTWERNLTNSGIDSLGQGIIRSGRNRNNTGL